MKNQLTPTGTILAKLRESNLPHLNFKTILEGAEKDGVELDFEDFLSYFDGNRQYDLHYTPHSVARVIAGYLKVNYKESALDMCCGTGTMLYYLQEQTPKLTGVEINEDVAQIASHFIPDAQIINADSFLYPFTHQYDVVIANVPWGGKVLFEHSRLPIEEAFLQKCFELLNSTGRAALVLPYSTLTSEASLNTRKLFSKYISRIIGLPPGIMRYTGVKTAIVFFEKKPHTECLVAGFNSIEAFENNLLATEFKVIPINKLDMRWDPEYLLFDEPETDEQLTITLGELSEISTGGYVPNENVLDQGELLLLKPIHLENGFIYPEKAKKYVNRESIEKKNLNAILKPGDIVISKIFNNLKLYHYSEADPPAFATNNLLIIRSKASDYLQTYLRSQQGKDWFTNQAARIRRGVTIPVLSIQDLAALKVPSIPVDNLNYASDLAISSASKEQLENLDETLKDYQLKTIRDKAEPDITGFIQSQIQKVLERLEAMDSKLDELIRIVTALQTDFAQIKALPRSEEEKIFKLCLSIDNKLETLKTASKFSIDNYILEIKTWLDLWELLDEASKKFLPVAEFIFDELSRLDGADFSPFVVQYCRTLENELLKKLFSAYHEHLKTHGGFEISADELSDKNVGTFAQMVKKDKRTYTLGNMIFIMSLLKDGGTNFKKSPLLQDFKGFANLYFRKNILEKLYLDDINNLTTNFRNKAAHPTILNLDVAMKCQELVRKNLNVFLESIRIFDDSPNLSKNA